MEDWKDALGVQTWFTRTVSYMSKKSLQSRLNVVGS